VFETKNDLNSAPPMFDTNNDLAPTLRPQAIELPNDRLADCIDFHTHSGKSRRKDRDAFHDIPFECASECMTAYLDRITKDDQWPI
jgi:hypothetical protein